MVLCQSAYAVKTLARSSAPVQRLPDTPYRADNGGVSVYPISLRDPLPPIQIPLRDADENVVSNLQAVLDRVYAEGPFGSIDYSKPPVPPLNNENATWAMERLKVGL